MKRFKITCKDNYVLDGKVIEPDSEYKYMVYILHGMCEHKDRYNEFMETLASYGYGVLICDLRGHGIHENIDDLGYFGDKEALIDDVSSVISYIKENYSDKKIIMYAYSMGSLIARNYIQEHDNEIDKLILSGPPTVNIGAGLGLFLSKFIGTLEGDHYRSKLIYNLSIGSYNRRKEMKNAWLVNDKKVLDKYNADSYCGFVFTTNGFVSLFYMLKRAYKKEKYKIHNKNMPILLLAGTEDRVVGSSAKLKHLVRFLREVGYSSVESCTFKGMRHELMSEANNDIVFDEIDKFGKSI